MSALQNGNYCAYLRKSRADRDAEQRGEGDTLLRHRKMLEELSVRMEVPIKKFYSEVVSGDTISARPVMQELLRDVEAGLWDGVFVVEVERLARGNTRDQGTVSDCFKYSGTKIITPVKIYDPGDEFDEEYFEFGLFMARREYKTINRRLQRGRIASVKEGKYVASTAPYGYRRVKIQGEKGYTLEPDERESEVVRMVFDWYCNGIPGEDGSRIRLGTDGIASRLDSLGIRPRVSARWSRATIKDMLQNPTYCGDVRFGYRECVKSIQDSTVTQSRKVNACCQHNAGMHPAIISRELFQRAQEVKTANRKYTVPASTTLQNPLSGLVYCKKCGTMMTRLAPNSRNKYASLKCPNKYCDNVSSPIFLIEEQILDFLQDWLADYQINPQSVEHTLPVDEEIKRLHASMRNNDAELAKLHGQLDKTYSLLEQEIYTLEVFRERQQVLGREIESLELANERYLDAIRKYEELKYSTDQFLPNVLHLFDVYPSSSPAVKNRLLKEVIGKIEYVKEQPNTRGNLRNANFTLEIYPKLPE